VAPKKHSAFTTGGASFFFEKERKKDDSIHQACECFGMNL